MLGRFLRIPNTEIRHHAEDGAYFFGTVKMPWGKDVAGDVGEEFWLLTDGDLRTGGEAFDVVQAGRGGVGLFGWRAGEVRFTRDGAGVEWNLVKLAEPVDVTWDCRVRRVRALALSDDRVERIRTRVERNQEDVEKHRERWLRMLMDLPLPK